MRQDTERRIKIYKEKLPHVREKIGVSGLALLIAGIVAVSATFAWVTLSRAPEVSGLATSMSANGSLEIALSKEDGSLPDEFDIDESVGIVSDVMVTNLTWGNLVNLSDSRYGIESLALRPAQLNSSALLTNPLWGAVYSTDGRITQLNTNYAYAVYKDGDFLTANNTYGVRAIASYTATVSDATTAARNEKIQAINNAHTVVNQTYSHVADEFSSLGTMISKYAQDKLDGTNTNLAPYVQNMIPCYTAVKDAMEKQMDAYVALANFQNHMYSQNTGAPYADITWDQIAENKAAYNAATVNDTSSHGVVSLVGLTKFITDYNTLVADIGYLNQYNTDYKNNGTSYYWASGGVSGHQLANIVADLIDYSTMTIDLKGDGKEVKVVELSGDNATDLLGANGQSRNVFTHNGILIRFEQLAVDENYRINGKAACTIKVTKILTITVNGKAYTKAAGSAYFTTGYNKAIGSSSLVANDSVAEDTYGMAIDFWIRTNAEETCLTLEGAVAMDEDGTIVSYDGINRVWGSSPEAAALPTGSTTQGGGSCYIYYADTPEDMARSLDLLEAMKVAFVDEAGNLLATAEMDTVNYFAANGRITVPLVLTSDATTTYTFLDDENKEILGRAVTKLYTDVPQRIETIVYLDGTMLGNDNVLSAAEIQGQLNIQFGSSTQLKTIGSSDLMDDIRVVTASVSKTELDYDTAVTPDDMTTDVLVQVEGANPSTVTAFFVRAINNTQGTREETFELTKLDSGDWSASYQFQAPGDYYLRYVRLDGVDFALTEPQKVTVKGFKVHSVNWSEPSQMAEVLTSNNSYSTNISVEFATNDRSRMPKTVQARFVRDDGNVVNVPLSYSSTGKWTGKASFTVSGTYTLEYLIMDGRYRDLVSLGLSKTINLSMGLYVDVMNGSGSVQAEYEAGQTYSRDVMVHIYNNTGNAIEGLTGAKLFYSNGGSATNTINTDLEWDEAEGCYRGTLPIIKAGRYMFSSVSIQGSTLTRCSESPIYRIISPDPPTFDPSSSATYTGDNRQFAPLTNDAVLDGIKIAYAESAMVEAVVYNASAVVDDVQNGYFTLTSENREVYNAGENWIVKLPVYTTDLNSDGSATANAAYTQEGTWQLVALRIYDCYDTKADYRGEDNPVLWIGKDDAAKQYLGDSNEYDQKIDFGKLCTTVSCTYNVHMDPGTLNMGGAEVAFMTRFPVSGTGMKVRLTDDDGNVIPSNKVGDVTLTLNYVADANSSTYGYRVQTGANAVYTVKLNSQDPDTGDRTVSEVNGAPDFDWQYVGRYNVQNLKVTLGSTTLTYAAANETVGVPTTYTITTAGPSAENVTIPEETINQRYTTLGKTGESVTGTFLQAQNPGVTAKVTLATEDGSDTQYVILDDVSMQFVMTYSGGSQANGGYTINGTSQYETVVIDMSNTSGAFSTSAKSMLAGNYTTQLKATIGGTEITKAMKDVTVYSKKPSATITEVSPVSSTFEMNTNNNAKYYDDTEGYRKSVQNYLAPDGKLANVYIQVTSKQENISKEGTADIVAYKLPTLTIRLADLGSVFTRANLIVSSQSNSSQSNTFSFTPSELRQTSSIGYVYCPTGDNGELVTQEEGGTCSSGDTYYIHPETQYSAGEQVVSTITAVDSNNTTYTVTLEQPITIRQPSSPPPSISYASVAGYNSFDPQESQDGGSFTVTLPTVAQFGTVVKEEGEVVGGVGWGSPVNTTSTKYAYAVRDSAVSKNEVTTGSGCNATKTTYYYYNYTFHKYTRYQYTYEQTSGTKFYNVTNGLTGWNVGGTVYAPGQTITVSGTVTATPEIGQLSKTFLREETVTMVHTTQKDVSDGTQSYSQPNTTYKSQSEALKGTEYQSKLPSGYVKYPDAADYFDSSWVNTTETQDGEDYVK